jgi:hypothetical protein
MNKKANPAKVWYSAITRRRFVRDAGLSVTALATGLGAERSFADELPRVAESDPMAKSLNYVEDATTVDAAKRASNRFCSNCALYQGDEGAEYGGCSIFPGKLVAAAGWCSVWAPKQGG